MNKLQIKMTKSGANTRIQPSHDEIFEKGDVIIAPNKDDKWEHPAKVKDSNTLHILYNRNVRKVAVY